MESFTINAQWADYINTLNKLGVPDEKVIFYLMWVKRSDRFLNGLPLCRRNRVRSLLKDAAQ
jgi:hypothetical protein